MIIHPFVNLYRSSQLSNKIKLLRDVGDGDTAIFDGKQWYYTKIELQDDLNKKGYILGDRQLTIWIAIDIAMEDGKLLAVQVAGYQDVIDELNNRSYMPYPADSILYLHAYGEAVDYGRYGKYLELKPVVKRRLVSTDMGLSWTQLDWNILDDERVKPGSKLITRINE